MLRDHAAGVVGLLRLLVSRSHLAILAQVVRIGDELVTYESVNASGLVGCTRGALGSKAAAHTSSDQAEHLAQMYDMVMPRPGSALLEEISSRLAHVYNHAELDMVYFDGAEGLAPMGSSEKDGQLLPFIAVFPQECAGQLAPSGPT